MSEIERLFLEPPADFASPTVAFHVAELDALTAYLFEELEGLGPAALAWQHAPGHNTIGMLLAHMAIVEVYWVQVGLLGHSQFDIASVIGIGMDDDGMPLPPGGAPPAALAGRGLAWYRDLVARARRYTTEQLRSLPEAALLTVRSRPRRDGGRREVDGRWVVFHIVEHFSGHAGQVLLVRHLQHDAGAGS